MERKKFEATTKMMLANAYNNWLYDLKEKRFSVVERATLEEHAEFYASLEENHGFRNGALEDISDEDLRLAMDAYRANTDWRCFSREDWNRALTALNGGNWR